MFLIGRIFLCLACVGVALHAYIDRNNSIVEVRREIPRLSQDVKAVEESNRTLEYQVERFESPLHLMELSHKPEYSHLRYPSHDQVIVVD